VWLGSGSGLPQGGIVRWIGKLPEMGSDWTVGVELVGIVCTVDFFIMVASWLNIICMYSMNLVSGKLNQLKVPQT